ncbi:MAG: HD domain-containing protein [Pirellulales bacterium]
MPHTSRLRPELLAVREQLVEERNRIREQHDRGLPSVQVCGRLTSSVDMAIQRLHDAALADMPQADANALREHSALVAHGGYGRRQLAPFSDVDLMLLHDGKIDAAITALARRLTQDVFDVGLQLGQSVRSLSDAVQLARTDPLVGTSLVESRLVLGGSELYEKYRTALVAMLQRRRAPLTLAFIDARRQERLKFGETVFVLEPNVKKSRGGLRDIHLFRWLWFLKSGEADPDRLHMLGHLSKFDHRRLSSSTSFLLRVRNEMHFAAGTARDTLVRPEQVRLAERFGIRGYDGLLPVEEFMRDYFRHTNHIWFLAHRMSDLAKPTPTLARVLGPVLGRNIDQDYRIGMHEISATQLGRTKLKSRTEEVLRLVDLARYHDRRIAQETWYHIYRSAPELPDTVDDSTARRFLQIMDTPARLGELLRRLHELGVLEKVIPGFTHARYLLQFNQYHKFTVDEHCIRAVEEASRFAERRDRLGEVYRSFQRKWLLHLALLLHDLGKGFDRDHSEVGAEMAAANAAKLGLSPADAETLTMLVRRHLEMSHLAFRRDTSDEETIARFAQSLGTPEHLTLIYLLTCADLAAVGPGVLNDWKVEVLTEIHARALRTFEPEIAPAADHRHLLRTEALRLLKGDERSSRWFAAQFDLLPETLLARLTPPQVVELLQRLQSLESTRSAAWGQYYTDAKTVEFTAGIAGGVGRGIFSSMAGTLSTFGMQIFAAETVVLADDLLLLRYQTEDNEHKTGPTPRERIDRIAAAMVASIDSPEPPKFRRIWGHDQAQANLALMQLPNEVRIDPTLPGDSTIVEVFTVDRLGLLYDLARTIHELNLVIRFAKIGTSLDRVVDVFYVTERDGTKPTDAGRLEEIATKLRQVIEPAA